MVTQREEEFLYLIEVMAKEASSIGMMCHEVRWAVRLRKAKPAPERMESTCLYDEALKKTAERIGSIIHLASERVAELTMSHASIAN